MTLIDNLALGFSVAVSPANLLYAFVGCMVGTLVGVLPGLGTIATVSMLLPVTFYLEPTGALIMLAGIYYGSQYGGSTTSILVNIPGESSSIITCLDGHAMARRGRAGAALTVAALGSFFAGTVGTVAIAALAPSLARVAISFGGAEYFSLILFGLVGAVMLASGSILKNVGMVLMGLLLSLIGTDITSGVHRYTFDLTILYDGIGFVPVALGALGAAEIIRNLEASRGKQQTVETIGKLYITWEEFKRSLGPVLRGTAIGSIFGPLPGTGAMLSSFTSYTLEKKLSRTPEAFGKGAIEGVAGPEAANNASAQTTFIPMLTLGIPSNSVMALMLGAMMIHGIVPGPRVMTNQPDLFWGIIVSMWVGNLMLLLINLPLVGMWVKLLKVPYRLLFPCIVLVVCIGAYSTNNSVFEVGIVAAFGALGYLLSKVGCEVAPLALGFVLGPLLESNLRKALAISDGDFSVFLTRPISLGILLVTLALVVSIVLPFLRKERRVVFTDDD